MAEGGDDLRRDGPLADVVVSAIGGARWVCGKALIDTAPISVLSPEAVQALGDELLVAGDSTFRMYDRRVLHAPRRWAARTVPDKATVEMLCAVWSLPSGIIVLLGRDFLAGAVLVYDGIGGSVTLSVPSR